MYEKFFDQSEILFPATPPQQEADTTRWQVNQSVIQSASVSPGQITSTEDSPNKRLRRVACTCPNCRDNDGK